MDRVLENFEQKIAAKANTVATTIGTQRLILADRQMMSNQVLSNILSNAIKFTPKGGVIAIGFEDHGNVIKVCVKDSGIGMPKEVFQNVFNSYKPTSRQGIEGEVGTGFGMPLVKAYVEKMGGSIAIRTWDINDFPEGHGTEITLCLPATLAS